MQDPYFSKGDGLIQVWYQIRISSTLQKCNLKHFKSLFSFHSSMKTSSVILNTGKRQFWWDLLMDLITGINKPVDNFSTAIHWSCTHSNISGVTTAFKYVSDFSNQIYLGELALKMWMIGWNDSLSYSNTKNHRGKLCASRNRFCQFTRDALNFRQPKIYAAPPSNVQVCPLPQPSSLLRSIILLSYRSCSLEKQSPLK